MSEGFVADANTFPAAEFKTRWQRAREAARAADLDALLAYQAPGNQFWLSGYLGIEPGDRFATTSQDLIFPKVLLPVETDPAIVGLSMGERSYRQQTPIEDIRTYTPPPSDTRVAVLKETIEDRGLTEGNIGVDFSSQGGITTSEIRALEKQLPEVTWMDATDMFYRLRLKKSEREIVRLQDAARIHHRVVQRAIDRVQPGDGKAAVREAIQTVQEDEGATSVGLVNPLSHYAFRRIDQTEIEAGLDSSVEWVQPQSIVDGYSVSSVLLIQEDQDERRELERTVTSLDRVHTACADAFQPGRSISTVSKAIQEEFRKHGIDGPLDGQYVGHSVGFDALERPWLETSDASELVLSENMVIAQEWFARTQWGPIPYKTNYVLRDDGLEPLSEEAESVRIIP